jgi:hypothetical protein
MAKCGTGGWDPFWQGVYQAANEMNRAARPRARPDTRPQMYVPPFPTRTALVAAAEAVLLRSLPSLSPSSLSPPLLPVPPMPCAKATTAFTRQPLWQGVCRQRRPNQQNLRQTHPRVQARCTGACLANDTPVGSKRVGTLGSRY